MTPPWPQMTLFNKLYISLKCLNSYDFLVFKNFQKNIFRPSFLFYANNLKFIKIFFSQNFNLYYFSNTNKNT